MDRAERIVGDRYALESLLGSGGMGEVWRARHVSLKSHFAVKLLASSAASSEHSRARFLTEAQIAAQLRSRHAVQVYDFGVTTEGQPFLVMELLDGETLAARIDRSRLEPIDAVRTLRQAARGLDRAHAIGIVHRDFKPANVLLCRDEEGHEIAKVVDFGVAKLLGQLEPERERDALVQPRGRTNMTRTGTMLGTPQYMAPEQIDQASTIGAAVDVWAFGVVAYECLVGRAPFEADDFEPLFKLIRSGEHVAPSHANPRLSTEVDDWFLRACAPSPHDRFPSAGAAGEALAIALDVPLDVGPVPAPLARSGQTPAATIPTLDAPASVRPPSGLTDRYAMTFEEPAEDIGRIELDVPRSLSRPTPSTGPPVTPRPTTPRPPSSDTLPPSLRAPVPLTSTRSPAAPTWLPAALAVGLLAGVLAAVVFFLAR